MRHLAIYCILLIACFACSGSKDSKTADNGKQVAVSHLLENIDKMCDHDTNRADAMLKAMEYEKLSDADRHYFDLLSIKIQDKKFEKHRSDSLILDVLDYYSSHRNAPEYPEVLYYGGRVYADLNDYSKSLVYFRKTLRELEDTDNIDLKTRTLSELSGLMQDLGQYKEAMDFAREAYAIDSVCGDPLHIMYDLERMGSVSLYKKDYENSETFFRKALALAFKYSFPDSLTHKLYLSAIKYHSGNIDSAKFLIRSVLRDNGSKPDNLVLAYASEIYRSASIPDSASLYAEELIGRSNPDNKNIGYLVLLSDELSGTVADDSIRQYCTHLSKASSDLLRNGKPQIISLEDDKSGSGKVPVEFLNGSVHSSIMIFGVCGIILAVMSSCVYIYIVRYRKNKTAALESEDRFTGSSPDGDDTGECGIPEAMTSPMKNADDLRDWLRQEVSGKKLKDLKNIDIPVAILQSESYKKIRNYCSQKSSVADNSPTWTELEELLKENIPSFIPRLRILCNGNLKTDELRIAMLTRIGIRPSEISRLICKEPSAVSYRKQTIIEKMFGKDLDKSCFDAVIWLL